MVVGELPRTSLPQINFVGSDIIQNESKAVGNPSSKGPSRFPLFFEAFTTRRLVICSLAVIQLDRTATAESANSPVFGYHCKAQKAQNLVEPRIICQTLAQSGLSSLNLSSYPGG